MSEASLAVQAFWPLLAFIAAGLPLSGLPWVVIAGGYLYFLHPTAALMFFIAAAFCGVVAIVPHEMAIAVWSPELDETGNSLAGVAVLEKLTQRLGRSVY